MTQPKKSNDGINKSSSTIAPSSSNQKVNDVEEYHYDLGGVGNVQQDNAYYYPEVEDDQQRWNHLYVLPVLLLEFLAIALTRAVLPSLLLQHYGDHVYLVMGVVDFVRGLLAFVACPMFGKISDVVGRKLCLFITVMGTCAPVCSLALFAWESSSYPEEIEEDLLSSLDNTTSYEMSHLDVAGEMEVGQATSATDSNTTTSAWSTTIELWEPTISKQPLSSTAITTFIILLALSGVFSSTFTLVFAYISDTVKQQEERVAAYGLALATFGLSFTIGPMAGGYLAQYNTHYVFISSLAFTIIDLFYIYFILPESRQAINDSNTINSNNSVSSILIILENNFSWKPWDTLKIIAFDPFIQRIGKVAFLYYTGLWAIISTLSVYAVKRFHLSPERLGELMSALGLCTMLAEAVLVRYTVPLLGEKRSMKIGLIAFVLQCVVLGFAYRGWHLFVCVFFSLFANLVYPSLSSLVSGNVEPESIGEALGAVNGIKALTEGFGPLVFGSLMTISEKSFLPGYPYLLAALLACGAYYFTDQLPDDAKDGNIDNDYIHELDRKKRRGKKTGGILMSRLIFPSIIRSNQKDRNDNDDDNDGDDDDEYCDLLKRNNDDFANNDTAFASKDDDVSRLPPTFASFMKQKPSD